MGEGRVREREGRREVERGEPSPKLLRRLVRTYALSKHSQ